MFDMSVVESNKANEWKKTHKVDCEEQHSAIGGRWTYCFTPTGLGPIVQIKCNICNDQLNVTDFGGW